MSVNTMDVVSFDPALQQALDGESDVVTTTTHKTLRGPRGGLILARQNESIAKRINSTIFPGTQGGPLMHVIGRESSGFHGSTATAIPGLSATSAAKCPCHVRD